jgi:hypothetical protein
MRAKKGVMSSENMLLMTKLKMDTMTAFVTITPVDEFQVWSGVQIGW